MSTTEALPNEPKRRARRKRGMVVRNSKEHQYLAAWPGFKPGKKIKIGPDLPSPQSHAKEFVEFAKSKLIQFQSNDGQMREAKIETLPPATQFDFSAIYTACDGEVAVDKFTPREQSLFALLQLISEPTSPIYGMSKLAVLHGEFTGTLDYLLRQKFPGVTAGSLKRARKALTGKETRDDEKPV
jgi:hypothetical protein